MAGAIGPSHVSRVRMLYKTVLRLHRGLPLELKAIGDDYVKSEFKRHVNCEQEFIAPFMTEWANYALVLAKQLQTKRSPTFGQALTEKDLDQFQEHQLGQLFSLYEETKKPRDPDNPMGENPSAKPSS